VPVASRSAVYWGATVPGCGGEVSRQGGSIYDLAAELDGLTPRGREFLALRERLRRT
jgi:hypothetical protein